MCIGPMHELMIGRNITTKAYSRSRGWRCRCFGSGPDRCTIPTGCLGRVERLISAINRLLHRNIRVEQGEAKRYRYAERPFSLRSMRKRRQLFLKLLNDAIADLDVCI